jgi:hypothetical protein
MVERRASEEPLSDPKVVPDASKERDFLPGVPTRRVLAEVGVLVPRSATISGDIRSREGVQIDTEFLPLAAHVKTQTHLGVVYLMGDPMLGGNILCSCQDGSGGCDTLTTEDELGNPGVSCVKNGCSGRCKMFAQ